jgi:hypothetical protein
MTDKQFLKAIYKTIKDYHKYNASKKLIEEEYVRRYNHHPSDTDNDHWIDSIHYGAGSINSIEEVAKHANESFAKQFA